MQAWVCGCVGVQVGDVRVCGYGDVWGGHAGGGHAGVGMRRCVDVQECGCAGEIGRARVGKECWCGGGGVV